MKLVNVLRLCEEGLGGRKHYEHGLRVLKTVVLAAAALKRALPAHKEESLVFKALWDVNGSKYSTKVCQPAIVFTGKFLYSGVFRYIKGINKYFRIFQFSKTSCKIYSLVTKCQYHRERKKFV